MDHVDLSCIKRLIENKHDDYEDDFGFYLEYEFPDLFDYGVVGKFQIAPTQHSFIDYVIDYESDANGEYGKTRSLYDSEKIKYLPVFQNIDQNIDIDYVRLVEFCWYNGCEAPSYYDEVDDPFFLEV